MGKIEKNSGIAVVIPSFRVRNYVLDVIRRIGPEVSYIYVVDDKCPENTGEYVEQNCKDPRVSVVYNPVNLGVGGATMAGYRQAAIDGATVAVKVDGDGQMNPELIPVFVTPILNGTADYTKGNRFFNVQDVKRMPTVRLVGNAILSFMTKLSSGYWQIFDPTNGYTAINTALIEWLPLGSISQRYFFETDLLFRLNTLGAVVKDIPMRAVYEGETSSLRISRILGTFLLGHLRNTAKRLFYNYFLRSFSIASVELLVGLAATAFGVIFGAHEWIISIAHGTPATSGSVMLAALPIVIGTQLILSFLNYDIRNTPAIPVSNLLPGREPEKLLTTIEK